MTQQAAKIACRNLWKIFGADPAKLLMQHQAAASSGRPAASDHVVAVRDVSFDVMSGEILVVMGLSGSGKSTLVRCLSRLIDPTAGQVLFDGRDLLKLPDAELIEMRRHKMGMVFSILGCCRTGPCWRTWHSLSKCRGVPRAKREERAREMVRLVGLEGREDYYPRELSGGQQQRVGIARSLSVEPEIWFLDEPFSALDPLIRREMQDEFLRLQRMLHKTIVFITHDFAEATRLADRIGIMKDGALIQLCTPEEMITNPADSYVAAFVKDAPRAKLISARTAMLPLTQPIDGRGGVPATAKIEEIARQVLDQEGPVPVLDREGRPIGILTRQTVADMLFGPRARA